MKRISGLIAVLCLYLFSSLAWGVDINTADAKSLAAELKGVGEKRAEAIVAYRKAHGPFKSVEELEKVKGISAALVNKNRAHLVASKAKK